MSYGTTEQKRALLRNLNALRQQVASALEEAKALDICLDDNTEYKDTSVMMSYCKTHLARANSELNVMMLKLQQSA